MIQQVLNALLVILYTGWLANPQLVYFEPTIGLITTFAVFFVGAIDYLKAKGQSKAAMSCEITEVPFRAPIEPVQYSQTYMYIRAEYVTINNFYGMVSRENPTLQPLLQNEDGIGAKS